MRTLFSAVLALAISLSGAQIAKADPILDSSGFDVTSTPGVSIAGPYNVTSTSYCLMFNDANQRDQLTLANISFVRNPGPSQTSVTVDNQQIDSDGAGHFWFCIATGVGDDQAAFGNPATATTIKFVAKSITPSTFNLAFKTSLKAYNLEFADNMIFFKDGKTYVGFTAQNLTDKAIALTVGAAKFATFDLNVSPDKWIIPASSEGYVQLGTYDGDISESKFAAAVVATISSTLPTTFSKGKLTLAKGLKLGALSALDWTYFDDEAPVGFTNATRPCVSVKNTSSAAITLKAKLTWLVGTRTLKPTGQQIITVAKGKTVCLTGNETNRPNVAGDMRWGKKASVSGSISSTKATVLNPSALTLPAGFTAVGTPILSYSSATKKTKLSIEVDGPVGFEDNLIATNLAVNSVYLAFNPVAGVPSSEPATYTQRILYLGEFAGDLRSGKKIKVSGTVAASAPSSLDLTDYTGVVGATSGCYPDTQENWDATAAVTHVTFICYNVSGAAVSFDLSGLDVTFTPNGGSPTAATLESGLSSVAVPNGTLAKRVRIAGIMGDARTGANSTAIAGTVTQN